MNWTQANLNNYHARQLRGQVVSTGDAVSDESKLHAAILEECNRRGWLVFHGSMAHRTYRTPGEPDFIILADGGATILVEAKTSNGKLSTDQLGVAAWARKLDHTVHVVRSLEGFLRVIEEAGLAASGGSASFEVESVAFEGPKTPDRGYTIRASYLKKPHDADALIEVMKDGQPLRRFLFPAYKIYNLQAHFRDIVDGEIENSARGYEMASLGAQRNPEQVMPNVEVCDGGRKTSELKQDANRHSQHLTG